MNRYQVEYDDMGNYRLCVRHDDRWVKGAWTHYQGVAQCGEYMALGEYWGDPQRVFKIQCRPVVVNVPGRRPD